MGFESGLTLGTKFVEGIGWAATMPCFAAAET